VKGLNLVLSIYMGSSFGKVIEDWVCIVGEKLFCVVGGAKLFCHICHESVQISLMVMRFHIKDMVWTTLNK
jgi:hypothetical protein